MQRLQNQLSGDVRWMFSMVMETVSFCFFFLLHISVCPPTRPPVPLLLLTQPHIHFLYVKTQPPPIPPIPAHLFLHFLFRTQLPVPVPAPPAGVPWASSSGRCSPACSPFCSWDFGAWLTRGPEPLQRVKRNRALVTKQFMHEPK